MMDNWRVQVGMYGSRILLRTSYTHHYACMHPGSHTPWDADTPTPHHTHTHTHTHSSQMLMHGFIGKLRRQQAGSRKRWRKGKRIKAPLFFVPLRLYRLVSPVHDQHLCLFQKLQTQSPKNTKLATSREREGNTHTHTHRGKTKGKGGEKETRGEKTGVGEQQRRQSQVVSSQIN